MPVRTNRLFGTTANFEGEQSGSTWWNGLNPDIAFGITDTIPGDTTTTASVPVGGSATAWISPANDTDWFSLNVVAGETYLVSMRGSGSDPIEDPYLVLRDTDGTLLIEDDDGGSDVYSLLTFTAAYTGVYHVEARTFSQNELPGEYIIDVRQQGADAVPDTFVGAVALDLGEVTFGFIEDGFDTVYTDAGEVDRYRFEVEAGKRYTIEVAGGADYESDWAALPPGELDTQIQVFNASFGLVTSNDDIEYPDDISARVTFTALESGTYYLDVYSWQEWTGGYTITAGVETLDPLDAIDWGSQVASNAVTVYFAESGESFGGVTSDGWLPDEFQQAMAALEVYSSYSGLTFAVTEVQAGATFTLVATDLPGNTLGFFNPPGETDQGIGAFDVHAATWTTAGALDQGGFSFAVMLHEFGHALGLAHPHDTGGTSDIMLGVTAPTESYGIFDLNQGVYTVMSYNFAWDLHPDGPSPFFVETIGFGWSGTPGALDIALIQQKYGAVDQNIGSNTYVLPTANAAGTFYACIWDTGGTDEIVQNGAVACRIDLTAATLDYSPTGGGVISFVDGIFGGFTIANSVVIENAGGGSGDDVLIGNDADNVLTGNDGADEMLGRAGADTLDGGIGADTMTGGMGDDTYVVDEGGDLVVEAAGEGVDTVQSGIAYVLGADLENLVLTGSAAINGAGNGLANNLTGNAGNNKLDGAGGVDQMTGGEGNDIFIVETFGDLAIETSALGGTDTVRSSVGYALGANIETLVLTGTNAISGSGNALGNVMFGNSAVNTLNGGIGANSMRGGGGDDTYIVDEAGDVAIEVSAADGIDTVRSSITFILGGNLENLVLTGTAAINGTGNASGNTITGNGNANTLNGGAGVDSLRGGNGNDFYLVDDAGDVVIETSAAGGTDSVQSSVSFLLGGNVENLTLIGSAANGTGNALANVINGNTQANVLNGGAGADTMSGGLGNDTYQVDDVSDQVIETTAGGGTDLVQSSVTFTLGTHVDNLTLTGSAAIDGTGNSTANTLTGNGGDNILDGAGNNDIINAGNGADTLLGGAGIDTLDGSTGNDDLHGGLGNDSLTGGSGNDDFFFDTALNAGSNVDAIIGFLAVADTIMLDDAIFTGVAVGTLATGAFRNGSAALDADDSILYDAATGQLRYDADGIGGAAAILFATVTPGLVLTNADFVGY